jgi:drug/metabolite transporter (DMT)-like permease
MADTRGVRRRFRVHPALAFVVVAWGVNFVAIKSAYTGFTPAAAGLLRYLAMVPLLLLWCWAARVPLRYPPGEFWRTNMAGFWGSGVYMVLFLEGMRLAAPAHAATALATAPILTTLMSVGLGMDRFNWQLAVGSAVAYFGVCFMALAGGSGGQGELLGTALVALSAVFWAWSVICYRRLVAHQAPLQALCLSFPAAMLVMGAYGARPLLATDWSAVPATAWWAMAYLVVVAGVLAFAAYYRGLKDVGPARTSLTQYFIPPTAALAQWLMLGSPPRLSDWVGLGLVAGGVALSASGRTPVKATA